MKDHRGDWNLQDAKARLSELVDRAQAGKPQVILRRGKPAAAVVSIEQYERLTPRKSLISFLMSPPFYGSGLEIPHNTDPYIPRVRFDEDE